jgi:hypothetical protein
MRRYVAELAQECICDAGSLLTLSRCGKIFNPKLFDARIVRFERRIGNRIEEPRNRIMCRQQLPQNTRQDGAGSHHITLFE